MTHPIARRGHMSDRRSDNRRRLGLLASSSLAALLMGGGVPAAFAAPCQIMDIGVTVGAISNPNPINCIEIVNSAVGGSVTNQAGGALTTNGTALPSRTGISVANSTISNGGSIVNNGSITAQVNGIVFGNNAVITGGISNSGTISAGRKGILVTSGAIFGTSSAGGGISNSGTISVAD